MLRISAITRVGLVAVACVAVAAPSALARTTPVKANAKSPYEYAMSYTPTKLTPEPAKPAKVQSWLYGYARYYAPTKATRKAAKPAKLYWYAMSYTPTKATPKAAKPATQTAATPSADPWVSENTANTDYEWTTETPSGS